MIHEKIIASIDSCNNLSQLSTCDSFENLPCIKNDHQKSMLRTLINYKRKKILSITNKNTTHEQK